MLQAWALKTILERMGHKVEFPCGVYNEVGHHPPKLAIHARCHTGSYARRLRSFAYRLLLTALGRRTGITAGVYYDTFRRKNLPERKCEVSEFGRHYDVVVLGSDQVLNPHLQEWTPFFLCRDIPKEVCKIAYAASIGEQPLSEEDTSMVVDALASFSAVSVREPFIDFTLTLDPTLLLGADDYAAIAKPYRRRKEYIYLYSCEASNYEVDVARRIAERLGLDLLITPTHGTYNRAKSSSFSDKISPALMVSYVKGAKYVLAGSFHGVAISLVHGKSFINVIPDHRSTKRVAAILETVGEADRIVNPDNSIDDMVVRLTRPLENACHARLAKARKESLEWLRNAIDEAWKR